MEWSPLHWGGFFPIFDRCSDKGWVKTLSVITLVGGKPSMTEIFHTPEFFRNMPPAAILRSRAGIRYVANPLRPRVKVKVMNVFHSVVFYFVVDYTVYLYVVFMRYG